MVGDRAKQIEIWDVGILVTHTHTWDTFDLVLFNVILGPFGTLVSKPV